MNQIIVKQFYKTIRSVIGESDHIGLHEPSFDLEDINSVTSVVRTGWVSYQGEMVNKFEQALANYLNIPHVVSVVNGTSALFIALKVLGIGLNQEVLLPSLTFSATANAICHTGAIPHFVDCCEQTFAIDWDKLEQYLENNTFIDNNGNLINKNTRNKITAIIPVYILGASFNIKRLNNIANKFRLQVIEDSAEALGSHYGDEKISALTGVGILSFNGNKIITTGGGGAVVVKDASLARKILHCISTAKMPHKYEFDHDEIGYNLRLPALNAALGYSQISKINQFLLQKRSLYNNYLKLFDNCSFGKIFNSDLFGKSNCWLNAFILDHQNKNQKNNILDFLHKHGIAARPLWKPLHLLTIYQDYPRSDCSVAVDLYSRAVCLPSSSSLGVCA